MWWHLSIIRSLAIASLLMTAGDEPVSLAEDAAPASTAEPQSKSPDATEIATLIRELDSNQYLAREQATQGLLAAGSAAFDPLLTAANGDRPEPADRAVWVLRKLAESDDHELGLAALDRLVQLKNRPAVVKEATLARAHFYELACKDSLAKLGAQLTVGDAILPEHGPIRLVQINLTENWRGTTEDLDCLMKLRDHRYFRVEGAAVGDAEVELFQDMNDLALLQIWKTKVTPSAVDAIKESQPKAVIYVRNRALLGIGGATHDKGVLVTDSRANMGAAAVGIAAGDVITLLDGKPVKDFDRLTARIAQFEPGDKIEVTLLRGEKKMTKRVVLSDWAMYE